MRFTALLYVLVSLAISPAHAATVAPTCTLTTPSPVSKVPTPATLILNFSSTNAASCTATSTGNQAAWNGSKALSGGQTLTGIKQSADYTYTCAGTPLSVGTALMSWNAPTLNTDGSTLKDLATYRLYWGSSALAVTQNKATVTDPAALVYTITDLPPGLTYFAASAVNAAGIESALSPTISKTITVPAPLTCSATIHIDVVTVPTPPTNLAVTDPQAFEFKKDSSGALVAHLIGRIPVGTVCSERMQKVGAISYSAVDMRSVDLFVKPVSLADSQAWAKCG
jgi:hypothetical protein